jgi:hypothetical protein
MHAMVTGSIANSSFERFIFGRNHKYNIGGFAVSIIDIEHGVLRAQSSKPLTYGQLSTNLGFSAKDPRQSLALTNSHPFVSFVTPSGCASSPPLMVLQYTSDDIDRDLERCGKFYLSKTVRVTLPDASVTSRTNRVATITLPEIFKFYQRDFGSTRLEMIQNTFTAKKVGEALANQIAQALEVSDEKPKLEYTPFDWTATLSF